jgi:hypothetical protein
VKEVIIPPEGIVNVVTQMRYPIDTTHEAFQTAANVLRNRVSELERELTRYKHAIAIMDECRLALYAARTDV